MIDTIKGLPWLSIAKWGGGLVALFFIAGWYRARSAQAAAQSGADDRGDAGGASMGFSPMFMSAQGMPTAAGAPAAINPLGGETWAPPVPASGQSDEVTIAQIQQSIAMAQLAAQQSIADKGFSYLTGNNGSLGATAGVPGYQTGGGSDVLDLSGLTGFNAPFQGPIPMVTKKVGNNEAVNYTKAALAKGDAGYRDLYNQAASRGYSDSELARIITQAKGGGNSAINATAVRSWIQQQGLKPLGS